MSSRKSTLLGVHHGAQLMGCERVRRCDAQKLWILLIHLKSLASIVSVSVS